MSAVPFGPGIDIRRSCKLLGAMLRALCALPGMFDGIRVDHGATSCRGFCSVLGPLQSVQRAEMWGVILALQSSGAVSPGC